MRIGEDDDIEVATCSSTIHIDVFDESIRVELLNFFCQIGVVVDHEKDAATSQHRVCLDDFQIGYPVIGEEIDRMGVDRQIEAIVVTLLIDQDIFMSSRREREQIAGHVFIAFVEIRRSMDAVREEGEVFGQVPSGAHGEGDQEKREERGFGAWLGAERFFQHPESGERCHEKDGHLGPNGTERMREPFIGEELRHEHDEK